MSGARSFKLFVGNLPWTVARREVSEYFSKFGTLRSASVVFNQETGMSKGYGFVEFAQKDGYSSAVAQDHHVLEGSKLTLGSFYSGRQSSSAAGNPANQEISQPL
ncbi:SRA stem-loop-interacting RNA-binding protein, mitochondrial-like [Littorina saxatilis]|uniref:RRM domain-containing protein n=1 Tax=Littorina saxatilis TaxID=31220 RepID=A0AAN9BFH8_9CAEN